MAYFMLVMGKGGICKGASSYRNNAGWHEVTDMHRPLSGSGYNPQGRDELKRVVAVKMVSEQRSRQISDLLSRDKVIPWVALELDWYGKTSSWLTFFDVSSAGYFSGTDDNSPTRVSVTYTLEFQSARSGSGAWPGALKTKVPTTGVDPERVVDRVTDNVVTNLPRP